MEPLSPPPPVKESLTRMAVPLVVGVCIGLFGLLFFQSFSAIPHASDREEMEEIVRTLNEIVESGTSTASIANGTFELEGAVGDKNYSGTVSIALRPGTTNVYDLEWNIGPLQRQIGAGILMGNVLSVGYVDTTAESINDVGSVSYIVLANTHLEGVWASVNGGGLGKETLIFGE